MDEKKKKVLNDVVKGGCQPPRKKFISPKEKR